MQLLSVNLSGPKPLVQNGEVIQTGILKTPQTDPVFVGELGLAGDVQVAKKHHGGPDQAVYLYSQEDYDWFSVQLERPLSPGMFGENLTVSSFGADELFVGDRLQVGEVTLEITAPRIPCATFAARMDDLNFVKTFKEAERPGVYARVLNPGRVQAGDRMTYKRGSSDLSVLAYFRLFYQKSYTAAELGRVLAAPIDIRGRNAYEAERAKLRAEA